MIAGHGILLLIGSLVFLVDDDQSEVLEREEYGTAGTEDHVVGILGELFLPDLHTLGIGILGVVDAQTVAKDVLEALHDPYRQCDLGQEVEHLFLLFQRLTDQVDIDLGLTAGGNTVEKGDVLFQERELDLVIGVLLDSAQGLDILQMGLAAVVQTAYFLFVGF